MRAFYVDQDGEVFGTAGPGAVYGGLPHEGGRAPSFDAASPRPRELAGAQPSGERPSADGAVWERID